MTESKVINQHHDNEEEQFPIVDEQGINEFLDQAAIALQGDHMGVKHAAANCVMRFADMDESYDTIAQKALKGILF